MRYGMNLLMWTDTLGDEALPLLDEMKEIGFVGIMMGRSDILAITMVRNTEHLARFVHTRISALEGVRRTESTLGVNFVKHDYRMARIVS